MSVNSFVFFENKQLKTEIIVLTFIFMVIYLVIVGNIRKSSMQKMMQAYHEYVIVGILDENETLQEAETGCKEFWLD